MVCYYKIYWIGDSRARVNLFMDIAENIWLHDLIEINKIKVKEILSILTL